MDANRYFIIMFMKNITETFTEEKEVKEFLNTYNKNNRDPKNPLVAGRLDTLHLSNPSSWIVKYSLYRKITVQKPLDFIDSYITDRFENEEEFKKRYEKELSFVPENERGKLYIGYMYSGQVRTLPIFYKKDKVYTDYESLTNLMVKNTESETFLSSVWANKKLNAPEYRKNIEYYLEKIQTSYGKYIMNMADITEVENSIKEFMKHWCAVDGKINQRRVREIGSIIKNSLENSKKETKRKAIIKELKPKEDEIRLF